MIQNQTIRLDSLQNHQANYNKHSDDQILRLAKSLATFGQARSIVVWSQQPAARSPQPSYTILAGHGVVEAARSLGWSELRADVLPDDWPETKALAYLVADNELARRSDPDQAQLAAILEELQAREPVLVEAAGYSNGELEALLRLVRPPEPVDAEPQIDRAEELRQKWGTATGQIWACGEHRLICGDCTDAATVARVMGGERADTVMTDPPYGIDFDTDYTKLHGGNFGTQKRNNHRPVHGDNQAFNPAHLLNFKNVVLWGANCYPHHLKPGTFLVWDKRNAAAQTLFSDAEIGWLNKGHGCYIFAHKWDGLNRASERGEHYHPTQKPIALWVWVLHEHLQDAQIVFDPYCGVGGVIIACENLGRRCRAIEISPAYVAVALERFATATGKQPHLLEYAPVLEVAYHA